MDFTRRELIRILLATPFVAGGCNEPLRRTGLAQVPDLQGIRPILEPAPRAAAALTPLGTRVIDVHAHFFNAADVPVRGFLAESLGHRAPIVARQLLAALARIADRISSRAPTAAEEIEYLQSLVQKTNALALEGARATAQESLRQQREATAQRVSEVIRGSEFERRYRQLKSGSPGALSRQGPVSADEVLAVVTESESPSPDVDPAVAFQSEDAKIADGILGFLNYMLGYRSANVDAYVAAYRRGPGAFGVDVVLGSLVDFDRWLEKPPRSAHDDQIALHALLAQMHGSFFRPMAAYNPWTDIAEKGAGLERVIRAVRDRGFVGVKIYPPTGFMPAANETTPVQTKKRRPDLKQLDAVLTTFFDRCAELRIPVIAHANRTNGRDDAHDEFSSPKAWRALLSRYASRTQVPVIDVGHFGGAGGSTWTSEFAGLMKDFPAISLYGDLGYWDELMCGSGADAKCADARNRLKAALGVQVGSETVADRVMFGSDWLMLSQVKKWANYPAQLHTQISAIAPPAVVAKIFGSNAERCFKLT